MTLDRSKSVSASIAFFTTLQAKELLLYADLTFDCSVSLDFSHEKYSCELSAEKYFTPLCPIDYIFNAYTMV